MLTFFYVSPVSSLARLDCTTHYFRASITMTSRLPLPKAVLDRIDASYENIWGPMSSVAARFPTITGASMIWNVIKHFYIDDMDSDRQQRFDNNHYVASG